MDSQKSRKKFAASMFVSGAVLGPLLDGIHGRVHLLEYDSLRVDVGGLHSSAWVALLLGTYYAVLVRHWRLLSVLARIMLYLRSLRTSFP